MKQLRTVLGIELLIAVGACFFAINVWNNICPTSISSCYADQQLTIAHYLSLATIRPFLLTPLPVFAYFAGSHFGSLDGSLLASIGALFSCIVIFLLAKAFGKRMVRPWLSTNLPQMLQFLRSQDWKLILATRLIPILPFDILTIIYGFLDFRLKNVLIFSFIGCIPETFIFAEIANPDTNTLRIAISLGVILFVFFIGPYLVFEYYSRKKGSSLWFRLKAARKEILSEVKLNNAIIKRKNNFKSKKPVLLLYGFFASRRSLTVIERVLTAKGYEVFSFNLGGLFGVFFTKGIIESAHFIDGKLKKLFSKYEFDEIQIVAHSKGGLVALWWMLKLGGHKRCNKLITMGTPFKGSLWTWLALLTPIGLVFKDVWQMRPGSNFLKALETCPLPEHIKIYNIYSDTDDVARGKLGVFRSTHPCPQVISIEMDSYSHFDWLSKREMGDLIEHLLGPPNSPTNDDKKETTEPSSAKKK